jgi:hypothetical protein
MTHVTTPYQGLSGAGGERRRDTGNEDAAGEPAEIRDEAMPPEVLVENNAHAVPQPPAQDQGELAVWFI